MRETPTMRSSTRESVLGVRSSGSGRLIAVGRTISGDAAGGAFPAGERVPKVRLGCDEDRLDVAVAVVVPHALPLRAGVDVREAAMGRELSQQGFDLPRALPHVINDAAWLHRSSILDLPVPRQEWFPLARPSSYKQLTLVFRARKRIRPRRAL